MMLIVKTSDPARTRTWNLLIRSQAPYPLGHRTTCRERNKQSILFTYSLQQNRNFSFEYGSDAI